MPGFDRTGPRGQGPLTGGGRGYCGSGRAGLGDRGYGVGRGGAPWGGGRGRCWGGGGRGRWGGGGQGPGGGGRGGWNRALPVPGDEREALRAEAADMEARLQAVQARLAELDKE